MRVRESCGCGATIEVEMESITYRSDVSALVAQWRADHNHDQPERVEVRRLDGSSSFVEGGPFVPAQRDESPRPSLDACTGETGCPSQMHLAGCPRFPRIER